MAKSTITAKNQTTVPKEIRERLGVGTGDVLVWEIVDQTARVRSSSFAFLEREGTIRVGRGSTVDDVRRARRLRGERGR